MKYCINFYGNRARQTFKNTDFGFSRPRFFNPENLSKKSSITPQPLEVMSSNFDQSKWLLNEGIK